MSEKQIIILVLTFTCALAILAIFFIILIVKNNKTNLNKKFEIYKSIIITQERERIRIGRNLHDELGSLLSSVKLKIDSIIYLREFSMVEHYCKDAKTQIDFALIEVRKIINDLVPHNIQKLGLLSALDDMAKQISEIHMIQIKIKSEIDLLLHLDLEAEISLFRIIQELFNNALKHSSAANIIVTFSKDRDHLILIFKDDGQGFDLNNSNPGLGSDNLDSRINFYHGEMKISSKMGHGTEYLIKFPLINLKS